MYTHTYIKTQAAGVSELVKVKVCRSVWGQKGGEVGIEM